MNVRAILLASLFLAAGCLDGTEVSGPTFGVSEQPVSPDCPVGWLLSCTDDANGNIYCWCEPPSGNGNGGPPISYLIYIPGVDTTVPDPTVTHYDCAPDGRDGTQCTDGRTSFDLRDVVLEACSDDPDARVLTCALSPASAPDLPTRLTSGRTDSALECPPGSILSCEFAGDSDEVVCWCASQGTYSDGDDVPSEEP